MAAKYAGAICYDNVHSYALAVAVQKSDLTTAASDSGQTTYYLVGELTELEKDLLAAGIACNAPSVTTTATLLSTAQANALTLAGTL